MYEYIEECIDTLYWYSNLRINTFWPKITIFAITKPCINTSQCIDTWSNISIHWYFVLIQPIEFAFLMMWRLCIDTFMQKIWIFIPLTLQRPQLSLERWGIHYASLNASNGVSNDDLDTFNIDLDKIKCYIYY